MFKKALMMREVGLGNDHPDTGSTYYNMATTLKNLGVVILGQYLNRGIGGVEIDILLVHASRNMPFLAIEIKKPSHTVTDEGTHARDPVINYEFTFTGTHEMEIFSSTGDLQTVLFRSCGSMRCYEVMRRCEVMRL